MKTIFLFFAFSLFSLHLSLLYCANPSTPTSLPSFQVEHIESTSQNPLDSTNKCFIRCPLDYVNFEIEECTNPNRNDWSKKNALESLTKYTPLILCQLKNEIFKNLLEEITALTLLWNTHTTEGLKTGAKKIDVSMPTLKYLNTQDAQDLISANENLYNSLLNSIEKGSIRCEKAIELKEEKIRYQHNVYRLFYEASEEQRAVARARLIKSNVISLKTPYDSVDQFFVVRMPKF